MNKNKNTEILEYASGIFVFFVPREHERFQISKLHQVYPNPYTSGVRSPLCRKFLCLCAEKFSGHQIV